MYSQPGLWLVVYIYGYTILTEDESEAYQAYKRPPALQIQDPTLNPFGRMRKINLGALVGC